MSSGHHCGDLRLSSWLRSCFRRTDVRGNTYSTGFLPPRAKPPGGDHRVRFWQLARHVLAVSLAVTFSRDKALTIWSPLPHSGL